MHQQIAKIQVKIYGRIKARVEELQRQGDPKNELTRHTEALRILDHELFDIDKVRSRLHCCRRVRSIDLAAAVPNVLAVHAVGLLPGHHLLQRPPRPRRRHSPALDKRYPHRQAQFHCLARLLSLSIFPLAVIHESKDDWTLACRDRIVELAKLYLDVAFMFPLGDRKSVV